MSHKCSFPGGTSVHIGSHELDPCVYEVIEAYKNVTVEVARCKVCGCVDISWRRQDNTEEVQ